VIEVKYGKREAVEVNAPVRTLGGDKAEHEQ